jgi:uncharacterized protein (TIGR03546 family)
MYLLIKFIKRFFKIFNSAAQPWQVFLGVLFGTLLGFLPVFSPSYGPGLLGCAILAAALVINCHLTALLLFFGIAKLLSFALAGPATMIGSNLDGFARASAEIPFLHGSLWSHTGWLGSTILGFCIAPIFAIVMWRMTVLFRVKFRDRLLARKQLVTAGKVGGNLILVRLACWFFDI